MRFSTIYIALAYFASFILAESLKFSLTGDGLVFWGCAYQALATGTLCATGRMSVCMCSNPYAMATMAGCMAYDNRNTTSVVKAATEICRNSAMVNISDDWFDDAYALYEEQAMNPYEVPGFNASEPVEFPFKFNGTYIELYYSAYDHLFGNRDYSFYYGAGALGYWLLVMLLEGVVNWSKVLFPGFVKKLNFAPITWWRSYVSIPATFRKRKAQELSLLKYFECLIPSRYESLVILGFYAYIIAVHCIKLHYVKEVHIFDSGYEYRLNNIADRTGIVATVMMPLVFLFGGRNNIMQWLTGMSHSQFMTYHRHIARVMVALVIIHSVNYTILERSNYSEEAAEPYFYWGIIATIAGGLIWLQTMLYFRRSWYEMFLLLHIALVALYIAGTWLHVEDLDTWSSATVVLLHGVSTATILSRCHPKAKIWYSIPGGMPYFLLPSFCFWQNHPFTFVDAPTDKNIIMYCKVKGGMTHGLYQYLAKQPDQSASIRVGVEGPYGEPTAARYADSAVFIASGNGIPGLYSEIMYGARKLLSTSQRAMKLIWIIREYSTLAWFQEELESLKDTNIQATIYVTKPELGMLPHGDKKIETKDTTDDERESIKSKLSHIDFREGRPSIQDIVVDEIRESSGSTAFVTCGHPAMVDELRYFVAQNVDNPYHKRVDFYEQLQVWA
ncbi:putative ferric reductase transmembrane component [Candida viswanathii]|uniref:Putative ferric reductase transmembrane component n=1 Tax=Candida viswanathii TaxID=5486 RepID=A0A367XWF4_9ASCO|nr:putative ferric reductase transmembrane component [Candida viswanathii]